MKNKEREIVNRVANSKLITLDLEEFYPSKKRIELDISQFLQDGFLLKEIDFRKLLANYNWKQYQDCFIALTNKNEAIIPAWAFMLLTVHLSPYAKKISLGSLLQLEQELFIEIINNIDFSIYTNQTIIVKGCSNKPIPETAFIYLIQKLQPVVKKIMFGEACSSVPLFSKQKTSNKSS